MNARPNTLVKALPLSWGRQLLQAASGGVTSADEEASSLRDLGSSNTPAVEFLSVGKAFNGKDGPLQALDDISFQVQQGEIFGIVGRSGAGKSTLLRTINGLERASAGKVLVGGVDVASLDDESLCRLRQHTGMIFQHFNLLPSKTAFTNVALPLIVAGVPRSQIQTRVTELLQLVGLGDKMHAYPSELSGGQKQRVGIARALVHRPQLLLCDEATSALDQESTQAILKLLRSIRDQFGLTIVLITHQIEVVQETCDRVAVISAGRIAEIGETWKVLAEHRNPLTAALLQRSEAHIPHSLAKRIHAEPPDGKFSTVVSLKFIGDSSGSIGLASILDAFGDEARLLYGGIEHVQQHAYGRLLVAVAGQPQVAELRKRADTLPVSLEVLGYVTSNR